MAVDSFEKQLFAGFLYKRLKNILADCKDNIDEICEDIRSPVSNTDRKTFLQDIFEEACELLRRDIALNKLKTEEKKGGLNVCQTML